MNAIGKINTKSVGLSAKILSKFAEDHQCINEPVMRVAGTVVDTKADTTQYGPYIKFIGSFKGVNLLTGEEFRSKELLLPSVAEAVVEAQVSAALANVPDGEQVAAWLGVDVCITHKPSEQGVQFTFTATPLMEPEREDPVNKFFAALPAPKQKVKLLASNEEAEEAPETKKGKKG